MKKILLASLFCTSLAQAEVMLEQLQVPEGFELSYYAEDVETARQLARSESGTVYAGSFSAKKVYAFQDTNDDGRADKRWVLMEALRAPTGIAYKDGDLYVADVSKIIRFPDIENNLEMPKSEVVYDQFPTDRHHGWKFLRFDDEGKLIVPVGAPCNICDADENYAKIFSLDLSSQQTKVVANGVRNSVGFDFHPKTGELWFSDNGRDMMGDDIPPCEINKVSYAGEHFGYPYFHGDDIADPEFGKGKSVSDYSAPALNLGAHVAPLGIHFYRGKGFPEEYQQQLLVAEHGSWNRSEKSGYRVMLATIEGEEVTDYEPLITGFVQGETTLGRPVAFLEMADGSVLISDDFAHKIYRLAYSGQ
ncbi:PQQ-dependent sugar dehydrogenase [Microbulbifer sp. OS29]|uniref:PQQ-dependent sugar dehydrogenase n=1 Tax=Microbulbifer okhotskensis TaxID=2926617 RepID=A0A9X2J4L5_9GAMM|nr:PQQ-dependent sugar dehydrogenase [Microbulbifer okhotskensis]MCO1334243.1 PQQ-dependent sugar dehydrogenase [Microbulbifer okhotskensis]